MIKAISLLKRKPGISLEEFSKHYEEVHVPLAMRHFPFKRYARNYVASPGAEELGFDCITEVWFETMADCEAAAAFSAWIMSASTKGKTDSLISLTRK